MFSKSNNKHSRTSSYCEMISSFYKAAASNLSKSSLTANSMSSSSNSSSSHSATLPSDTATTKYAAQQHSDIDFIDQGDYCLINKNLTLLTKEAICIDLALRILLHSPLPFQHNHCLYEFKTIHEPLYTLLHQLDDKRRADQFALTSTLISPHVTNVITFIANRYKDDRWGVFMGLLMVAVQITHTASEVKTQLLSYDRVGRILTIKMVQGLLGHHAREEDYKHNAASSCTFPLYNEDYTQVLDLILGLGKDCIYDTSTIMGWKNYLTELFSQLEKSDSAWKDKQKYKNVIDLANELLLQNTK